jgi:hypothetical protein
MRIEQFKRIAHLEGLDFIQAFLRLEEQRFEDSQFLMGSTFEDINADFGIFPKMATYPVYFAGDIGQPTDKIIFMGINPGFGEESNRKEREFLRQRGIFEGYCRLYGDYQFGGRKVRYNSNIAGFLRRLYGITESIDWNWFQEHLITLELIPYHSVNAKGLRINNAKKYREVYFEIILNLLRHLNPQKPLFINGFPTFRNFMTNKNAILPEFVDVIEFSELATISTGRIGKKYDFVGLPFLGRQNVGIDAIVAEVLKTGLY